MTEFDSESERRRRMAMRPNAHLYMRPDAYRFMPSVPPRWATKEELRLFWGHRQPDRESNGHAQQSASAAEFDELLCLRRVLAEIKSLLPRRLHEAKYDPNQPRDGRGRWTDGSNVTDTRVVSDVTPDNQWKPGTQFAQNRPRTGPVVINGRPVQPTPGQAARLTIAEAQSRDALARVKEVDPNWRPTPSAYETVEGLIRAHRETTRDAEARIAELRSVGIGFGRYAHEAIPARGPGYGATNWERDEINRIGREWGCHTCGTKEPGTRSGNFVRDHQPPNAWSEALWRLPHCRTCSNIQGGYLRWNGRAR